jgi:hypothetical protein
MNNPVVISEGTPYTGAVFAALTNGGEVALNNGFALRITKLNEKFSSIQLISYGIGVEVRTSTWRKPVKPVIVQPKKEKPIDEFKIEKQGEVNMFE